MTNYTEVSTKVPSIAPSKTEIIVQEENTVCMGIDVVLNAPVAQKLVEKLLKKLLRRLLPITQSLTH